jgi:methylmalonyl-CoA mutase
MEDGNPMFGQFGKADKAAWRKQLDKELKGEPYEALLWSPAPDILIEPYYTDQESPQPKPLVQSTPGWEIGEMFDCTEPAATNFQMLNALHNGVEAVYCSIRRPLSSNDLDMLFKDIELPFISLHFLGETDGILRLLLDYAARRSFDPKDIKGSLSAKPAPENYLFTEKFLPSFSAAVVDVRAESDPLQQLATALGEAKKLLDDGCPARQIQFSLNIGTSYFLEIAKLRALKILWINNLNITDIQPIIETHFLPAAYTDDLHTNMIRATTMAMSAILGGTNRLVVLPSDQRQGGSDFGRRIARNVQHLLRLESYFGKVADPAAGSYYIEKLTALLVGQAENLYQNNHP